MFYLFVCLTQDGWMEIFKAFQVGMRKEESILSELAESYLGRSIKKAEN